MVQVVLPSHRRRPGTTAGMSTWTNTDTHPSFSSSNSSSSNYEGWNLLTVNHNLTSSVVGDDEQLTFDPSQRREEEEEQQQWDGDAHTDGTWQEEAHWMSFRHAVQRFALVQHNNVLEEKDEQDDDNDNDATDVGFDESSESDETAGGRDGHNDDGVNVHPSRSVGTNNPGRSDLAKTRLQLALAEAKRDELEFVLLQQQQQRQREGHGNKVVTESGNVNNSCRHCVDDSNR